MVKIGEREGGFGQPVSRRKEMGRGNQRVTRRVRPPGVPEKARQGPVYTATRSFTGTDGYRGGGM